MSTCAIIPARYKSTRFPAKPLQDLLGRPMVIHVCERALSVFDRNDIYVATEDQRIADVVEQHGFQYVITSDNCLTGTDRVAEAALSLPYTTIVNIQGDEPALPAATMQAVLKVKEECPGKVVNAMALLSEFDDPLSVNLPKVVCNEQNHLLYMSRAGIPGTKGSALRRDQIRKQVCVYGFERYHLEAFVKFGRKSRLEEAEDIEILRFFELGIDVQMVEVSSNSVAVDEPDDVPKAEAAVQALLNV